MNQPAVETKEIVVAQTNAVSTETRELSSDEIDTLHNTIAKDLNEYEFKIFIRQINRTGLDPFSNQIYTQKRRQKEKDGSWGERMVIGTGIDGFRLIAQRTGRYAGQVGPFWCGDNGKWVDVWLPSVPPKAAKVGILRAGFKEPLWSVAKFETYSQKKSDGALTIMWQKMPEVMIAKCAEALGLRRAFPQELSGMHTREELEIDGEIETESTSPETVPQIEGPKEDEVQAYFKEAVSMLETSQTAKQLEGRRSTYREYKHYTDEMKKELTIIYNRRLKELVEMMNKKQGA